MDKTERPQAANGLANCTSCHLHTSRAHVVMGQGTGTARIMFIGEAPGAEEDAQGVPFVGRAGDTLRGMIKSAGIDPNDCRITNIVRCRPPKNRRPSKDEIQACIHHLAEEINEYKPKAIITVGLTASQTLLNTKLPMAKLITLGDLMAFGIQVFPVYHTSPLCINRTPGAKKQIWAGIFSAARLG